YFPALKPDNECLATAARFNHLGVLQVLLDKDNLDPTYEKNKPIRFAAEYGSKDCVVFLQSIETVNAGDCENYALRKAVENKHHAVVKKLMIDKNVDVEVFDGLCLVIAAENNDQEMVRILVNDTPIDTSAQDYLALVRATERENREVVTFIYQRSLQQGKPFIFEEDDELSQ